MKKLTRVFITILFALSMTGLCFAQAQAPAPAKGGVLPESMEKPVQKPTPEELKKMKEQKAEKKKAKVAKEAEKEKAQDVKKAEKKKAKEAKKAEKKKARDAKKAEMKEQWKKDREAPKPAPGPAIPVEEKK